MSETIGQRLKREREARYLTLEKASDDTRIRKIFIEALEADDFSAMPSATQGRGFLRNYAAYLDLDIDELIAEIQKNRLTVEEISGPLPQVNLVETEVPPLTDSEAEPPAPFWTRWFGRKPQAESTTEAESTEPPLEEMDETNAKDESQPVEIDQIEFEDEPELGIWSRLLALIPFRKKTEAEVESDIPEKVEEPVVDEVEPQKPLLSADAIFAEIGAQLRERRELISLTYEEVERHIHLRMEFVKALEEGAFGKLPLTVQTRGMLSNYATFLDLDTDTILLRFADALQARHREKYAEIPRDKIQTEVKASIPLLRMFIAGDLLFGVVMIVLLIALAIWGVGRVMSLQEERNQIAEATAPPIVDVLGAESEATPSQDATLISSGENALTSAPLDNNFFTPIVTGEVVTANVTVSLFAVERVFVRISVDGEVAFEGRMAPRETKVFEADNQIVILTGNAAALRVTYNGRDLGLLGGVGEVVSRVYLETSIVTPTATIPPTPTNTPLTTPTSTPTNTPTATPTVTPPDGG